MDIFIEFFKANLIYLIIALCMYIFDTVSGFAKVFYKRNYESEKARKAFSKLLVFVCLAFAVLGIDILISVSYPNFKPVFCKIICIAISFVELTSIGENLEDVTGKNYITLVISYIKNQIKSILDNFIGKDDSND